MVHNFIHRLLLRRHFWRHATFSEIGELYASRMLRMVAFNLAASFMSIFLYQTGYSVMFIVFFWAGYFTLRAIMVLPAVKIAARIGAKHGIFVSNLLFIPSMVAFSMLPTYGMWVLPIVALFQASSTSLYALCHAIDFSKIKSVDHAGKELAYMNIIEKLATGLSPLVGGVLAYFIGPQIVIVLAAVVFALAALPLFKTGEPVPPGQKINLVGFPWRLATRNIGSQIGFGIDVFASGSLWSLFIAITVLGVSSTSNGVYAANGILLSVVLFAAIAASYVYGKLIDNKKGLDLLRFGVIADAIVHLTRPFITHPVSAGAVNIANEAATTGYGMAYTRGVYDAADFSGQRIVLIGFMEIASSIGAAIGAAVTGLLVMQFGDVDGMRGFFIFAGVAVLLILTSRFPLYQK